MKTWLWKIAVIVYINTIRRFLSFMMNGMYNEAIRLSPPLQAKLKLLNSSIQSSSTVTDLVAVFKQVFKGYQTNKIGMTFESMWRLSFSTVMTMNREVCQGDAAVNFYLSKAYARVMLLNPVYVKTFGIWNTAKGLGLMGHAMTVMVMADSSCVLLDYTNQYTLKSKMDVKNYYIKNYCSGKGTIKDIVTVNFPDIKSYGEK